MKTTILLHDVPLQTLEVSSETAWKMLEAHFRKDRPHLIKRKFSLRVEETINDRSREQIIRDCQDVDGCWGVRYFRAARPGFLLSPTSEFVWETASAEADDFSNAEAVRGHSGFHAAWVEDLNRWPLSIVDHIDTKCKALVKGFGDVVQGEMGFRSSKMRIIQIATHDVSEKLNVALVKRYGPHGVTFFASVNSFKAPRLTFDYSITALTHRVRQMRVEQLMNEYK